MNFKIRLQSVLVDSDKWKKLKKEIEKTDKEIDWKVFKLYGLSEEEIKIVNNSNKK